MNPLNVIMNLS